jgi:hypothetical protein
MAAKWEGYQMLAMAVLEQAWRDAQKPGRGAESAQEFLLTPSPLLKHWSHQAGMSYQWVQEQAERTFSE